MTIHAIGLQGGWNFSMLVLYCWEGLPELLTNPTLGRSLWNDRRVQLLYCGGVEQWIGSIHTPGGGRGGCLWSIVRWASFLLSFSSFISHLPLTLATSCVLMGAVPQRWDEPRSRLASAGLNVELRVENKIYDLHHQTQEQSLNTETEGLSASKALSKWNNMNKYG